MIHVAFPANEGAKSYDIFSADVVKAFYNLNRDIALKKLKEVAPQFFNLFMDKYNDASNGCFFLFLCLD